ncbi:histidine-containing phosphotransfer protein 1-like [Glycine soja]|uniref:histidine-containing phosphotransfer protein 1-like n=1 Tax=Glycine soja TaxID=3848 RepID=UPI0010399755|nr:histidine-containing phosphotransfer protein 1-like [Glycine soja]
MDSMVVRVKGFLDDQFNQLQKLQDESSPYFVMEVMTMFFGDSEKLLNRIALALEQKPVDFKSVDSNVHQFKGSSASVGVVRVKDVCTNFRNICEAQNLEGRVVQTATRNPSCWWFSFHSGIDASDMIVI